MAFTVLANLHVAAWALLCMLALQRGGALEKALATACFGEALLQGGMSLVPWWDTAGEQVWLEALLLAWIAVVAVRSHRAYPLWLGGAQIITVSAFLMRASSSPRVELGSLVLARLGDTVGLLAMASGLWRQWRRGQQDRRPPAEHPEP